MFPCALYSFLDIIQVYSAPFAVILDHSKKSIVITIRGSLSVKVSRCYLFQSVCSLVAVN